MQTSLILFNCIGDSGQKCDFFKLDSLRAKGASPKSFVHHFIIASHPKKSKKNRIEHKGKGVSCISRWIDKHVAYILAVLHSLWEPTRVIYV